MGISASLRSGARRVGVELRKRLRRLDGWWLLALFGCLGVVAVITGARRAYLTQDEWLDELWLDVAKAGVQVVAVGVLGGALAVVWRNITARREAKAADDAKKRDREIERNDKIGAELVSLVALYNRVKSVRRTVRSLGLDLERYPDAEQENVRQTAVLTEEQASGFHAQMLILNGLQLDFESKAKQFGQTNFLDDDTNDVVNNLGRIEDHLNGVLELWENSGWTIQQGTPLRVVSDGLVKLLRVRHHFRPEVSDPMKEITRLINKHVFGEASEQTEIAFQTSVSKRELEEDGHLDKAAERGIIPPILWVDDAPQNNAALIDAFRSLHIEVDLARSTAEALDDSNRRSYGLIISDLGRREDGSYKPTAGIDLIQAIRSRGESVPIFIFATRRAVDMEKELKGKGATLVTSRPSVLLEQATRTVTTPRP